MDPLLPPAQNRIPESAAEASDSETSNRRKTYEHVKHLQSEVRQAGDAWRRRSAELGIYSLSLYPHEDPRLGLYSDGVCDTPTALTLSTKQNPEKGWGFVETRLTHTQWTDFLTQFDEHFGGKACIGCCVCCPSVVGASNTTTTDYEDLLKQVNTNLLEVRGLSVTYGRNAGTLLGGNGYIRQCPMLEIWKYPLPALEQNHVGRTGAGAMVQPAVEEMQM